MTQMSKLFAERWHSDPAASTVIPQQKVLSCSKYGLQGLFHVANTFSALCRFPPGAQVSGAVKRITDARLISMRCP